MKKMFALTLMFSLLLPACKQMSCQKAKPAAAEHKAAAMPAHAPAAEMPAQK